MQEFCSAKLISNLFFYFIRLLKMEKSLNLNIAVLGVLYSSALKNLKKTVCLNTNASENEITKKE